MVIGGGMMATAFSGFIPDNGVVVFASGVSDSSETREAAFDRERALLQRARVDNAGKLIVYFGTCSVADPDKRDTPYVRHKIEMERLLQESDDPWIVLRVPLAIGPIHRSRTLAQFLYEQISNERPFKVWTGATRYPLDVADAVRIATLFIERRSFWNQQINMALSAFPVLEFVRSMETIVGKTARCDLIPKGEHYNIPCPEVAAIANRLGLDFSEQYLDKVLRKYFWIEA